ncbi:MAG TPA: Sua5 family C-terminal domain-containing protein, partial [Candidatus Angelobacter sp.]|nr:Sua5 family C-terminal domain-containing protein [Candidatus Angelobacter sp.]
FDELDVDLILSETFPNSGIGGAIMNRLTKAAGGHIIGESTKTRT